MKIKINYDLLERTKEANIGYSLVRTSKKALNLTLLATLISTPFRITRDGLTLESTVKDFFLYLMLSIMNKSLDLIFTKANQEEAIKDLKKLSLLLGDLNMCTDYELLLEAYKYSTEYSLEFNEYYLPCLKEEKYIMVPVYDNGEVKEVSLVQEHIVGKPEYTLSCGSPQKSLKLAFNQG